MKKPSRRKKARRTKKRKESQRTQKLSREVRELYAAVGTSEDISVDEEDWGETFLEAPEEPTRRPDDPWQKARQRSESRDPENRDRDGERLDGRVIAVSSGACAVEKLEPPYESFTCSLPSMLAVDQQSSIAVGDEVHFAAFSKSGQDTLFRIEEVLPRRTVLSRPDILNPRVERVIAANVDLGVHVVSVIRPPLRLPLIDRYMIAIERGGAEPLICINKVDLLPTAEARAEVEALLEPYRESGRGVLYCSVKTGEGLDALRTLLRDRTAVFVGHSGVGKSSLINGLSPDLELETRAVSQETGKGRHTTTRSSLFHLDGGRIRLIDTPGVREFGLWRLEPRELRAYFPDFDDHAGACRFADCSHVHEPECAVREAVASGEVAASRYQTYCRILESLLEEDDGERG